MHMCLIDVIIYVTCDTGIYNYISVQKISHQERGEVLPEMFQFNVPLGELFSALINLIDKTTKRTKMRGKQEY